MGLGGYFLLGCLIGVVVIVWSEVEKHKKKAVDTHEEPEAPPVAAPSDSDWDLLTTIAVAALVDDVMSDRKRSHSCHDDCK